MRMFGSDDIERSELLEWFNDRYEHLDQKIAEADMNDYEDQIRIVEWKGRQQELHLLLERFDLDKEQ